MTYHDISKGTTAIAEYDIHEKQHSLHFATWWNGEGGDFTLTVGRTEQRFSLHLVDMEELFAMMVKAGFVDIDYVKEKVLEYK